LLKINIKKKLKKKSEHQQNKSNSFKPFSDEIMTFIQLLLIVLQLPWKYCRVPLIYPPLPNFIHCRKIADNRDARKRDYTTM
jgi:hypothetical protein